MLHAACCVGTVPVILLLAGAGLLLRSFVELIHTDSGVETKRRHQHGNQPNWTGHDHLSFAPDATVVEKVRHRRA